MQNPPETGTSGPLPTGRAGASAGTFRLESILSATPLFIEITEEDVRETRKAKAALRAAIGIEQKFWLLVDNFRDYELCLLELALDKVVRRDFQWRSVQADILAVNRRLVNFLSSARLYVDHLLQDLISITEPADRAKLEKQRSIEYDSRLGYRTMEALRNTVQHSTLGVTGLRYPRVGEQPGLSMSVHPTLDVPTLRDAGMKAKIADELRSTGGATHDVTPYVREYMEGLGSVHRHARALMGAKTQAGFDLFNHWLTKASETWPRMTAFQMTDNDRADGFQLFKDLPEQWEWFLRNTHTLNGIANTFVSGRSPEKS